MLQFSMMMLMTINSLIFMTTNHPLMMGLTLLMQTIIVCMNIGMISSSFWFSYILFIIFVGGMLVLFIYVTSLASNEMFSLSVKILIIMTIMFTIMMSASLITDKFFTSTFMENTEMQKTNMLINYLPENTFSLTKLYNFPTNMITLLMINYLLITLVAVVKITNMFQGPLRHMN